MKHKRQRRFADYPRPSVAVDVVCLTVDADGVSVLLYERSAPPQAKSFALPGGFVQLDESLEAAAERLRAQTSRGLGRATSLRHGILSAAFSSRLTGQSADAEVISELTEKSA